jgi:DNA-directed RNA polymerase subunit RPC12/RpoP
MSILFACEGCGAKLVVKDEAGGRRVKCPKCGARIEVPVYRIVLPIVVEPDEDFAPTTPQPPIPSATHVVISDPTPSPPEATFPHWSRSWVLWGGASLAGLVVVLVVASGLMVDPKRHDATVLAELKQTHYRSSPRDEFLNSQPERQLAILQAGKIVPASDPLVSEIRSLIKTADALYKEDFSKIANMTLLLWNQLDKVGMETRPTDLLNGSLTWTDPSYFKQGVPRKFAEYYALYLTLRIGDGKDRSKFVGHKEAIEMLMAVAHALSPGTSDESSAENTPPRRPTKGSQK